MSNKFTPKAQYALNLALTYACELGHSYIGSEHLLLGLLSDKESVSHKILSSRGIKLDSVKSTIVEITGIGAPATVSPSDMTPKTKKIIENSAYHSSQNGQGYIGTEHILLSMIQERDCVATRILESSGAFASDIKRDIDSYIEHIPKKRQVEQSVTERGVDTSKLKADEKSAISSFGRNLSELARLNKFDPIIGRESETERVIQILTRRNKNNPCLIGEPGVGKTAVVEGLAQKIAEGSVPEILRNKSIISLDLASMIAGAKYRGEFEDRLKKVLNEAHKNPNIIIFIDEIHTIVGAGAAEGAIDAANIIKPALARGELQVIGATTISEYRKYIEKDAALERRFQSVSVGEPTEGEALQILYGLRQKYEDHHNLIISDEALLAAVNLSTRYITDRYLPDKAIDLVDEAAARLRLKMFTTPPEQIDLERRIQALEEQKTNAISNQNFELAASLRDKETELKAKLDESKNNIEDRKRLENLTLCENDIAEIVTQWTGIPVSNLLEDENKRLINLESSLEAMVIGQRNAISAISDAIRRGRTGLKSPDKPIGSFIFAGQTGVGKTRLCRALALVLFGSENAMIRLDMSEYMEKHSISKLIGSPPGYVGFEEGGHLTEKVRRNPYSILLFDEIEKAHPDIFNILLQILDDGALTDSQGKKVNFKNCIIIMTTNLGARIHGEVGRLGFISGEETPYDAARQRVDSALKSFFRPEFLNRVDEIIVFNPLSDKELEQIVSIMLAEISDRIEGSGIFIEFDNDIPAFILSKSNIQDYGARPLRRTLTRFVETPYSKAILGREFSKGDFVFAKCENDKIIFTRKKTK